MALQRMKIQSVVVGSGPVSSLVILSATDDSSANAVQLPIRIGHIEAMAIGMGISSRGGARPMTHDLMMNMIRALDCELNDVVIHDVHGTTFYAQVRLTNAQGAAVSIDSRPSDALALAVRMGKPIYADDLVIEKACLPDFDSVERDQREHDVEAFHEFVENLSPEDFQS